MTRTLRTLALPAAAALMLTGCSLPFKIVPNDEEPTPAAQEETPTQDISPEEAETPVEVEEPTTEEPTESEDGPNYSVGPAEALPQVVEMCDLPDDVLLDDGMTLLLDSPGEDADSGDLTPDQVGCALGVLQLPDWVAEEIKTTTALDGRQKAVDGYITWSWTFSSGEGLDFLITVSETEA